MKCGVIFYLMVGLASHLLACEFKLEPVKSGINYPTEGNEKIVIKRGKLGYHCQILHPGIAEGPHLSVPLFWISMDGEFTTIATAPTLVEGLHWHSLNQAYFFSEMIDQKKTGLSGFFLEDGRDNADSGARGLICLYDGKQATIWRWVYHRDSGNRQGYYQITESDKLDKAMPEDLIKRLAPILTHAEKEADAWTGP